MQNSKPIDIDTYIGSFPPNIQKILKQIRATIKKAAPAALEKISYSMPAFYLYGNLVYFAAFKDHIGFFPTSSGIEAFKTELAKYKWAKGTIRFPFGKPLPLALITRIVKFRVKENIQKTKEIK